MKSISCNVIKTIDLSIICAAIVKDKFEDTKGVTRGRQLKDRQRGAI
jgi:hypothetical protein